jgi:putative endopeptidase
VAEDFQFYSHTLRGVPQNLPRWKRVLAATDGAVGEDLGQLYVAQAFPPAAKARALALVQNLKAVLRNDLGTLTWMSPATKYQAQVKLDTMAIKIGYPDHWRDYSKLDVTSPSYVVNAMRADQFEFDRDLHKIGKPVDLGEWHMTPPTVNAYYSPLTNDINFPAGILQPPFFDPKADDAVNYGGIGAVIGHEMTHGFDDQGRKFDAHGNLHDWWAADDAKNFDIRAQGIVAQYSAFEPLPGQHINGSLTQGENIADIGGLKIAYLALEKSLAGKPRPKIDGFTPEQRFFLAYGQIWRGLFRSQTIKVRLATDPHSPNKYRVLGALADMPEFRQAFGCPPDPKASPTTIW